MLHSFHCLVNYAAYSITRTKKPARGADGTGPRRESH
jgi:hypothetical protein